MTSDEIYSEYRRLHDLQEKTYLLNKKDKSVKVEYINYGHISELIKKSAREKYKFPEDVLIYIWCYVSEKYHSSFDNCIYEMTNYCDFVKEMPNFLK